jgi:carotenoid cleavage dioxygenase
MTAPNPLPNSSGANPYLAGNYAPVSDEISATELPMSGRLPEALSGRYFRTGPNPHGTPAEPYHWFLGEGMIHGVRIRDGRAEWYRNRWVRTDPVADALGEPHRPGPAQPMYDMSNTNVLGFGDRILSLTEGAYPYELTPDLDTIGRFDGSPSGREPQASGGGATGALPHGMTAHPKIDPRTHELVGFSYWWEAPYLYFHVVDASGAVTRSVPIDLPRPVSMHDFAITEHYALFFDQPYVFDLEVAAAQGFPFRWRNDLPARVGVLPRDGDSNDIRWFDTETCYCFHPMNAYEADDGTIVVDIPKMSDLAVGPAPLPSKLTLERWTIDPTAGVVKPEMLDDAPQEFCRVNESLLGTRHRYGYTIATGMGAQDSVFSNTKIYKRDFAKGAREDHDFGAGRHAGEFVFVADPDRADAEDGGWLMGLVHDDNTDHSELVVLDAQDFAGAPVSTVTLPRRVPYGFHGNWIADSI